MPAFDGGDDAVGVGGPDEGLRHLVPLASSIGTRKYETPLGVWLIENFCLNIAARKPVCAFGESHPLLFHNPKFAAHGERIKKQTN